jgi:hypothetical protein
MATPTLTLDDNVKRLLDQQDQLLKKIAALEKPGKDFWDKLGALSGLLIALVGGVFSYVYNAQQSKQSQITENHQTRLEEVQTVGTFMPFLVGNDATARSIALAEIEQLPNQQTAILIAEHVTSAQIASGNPNGDPAALKFLQTVAKNGTNPNFKKLASDALTRIEAVKTAPADKR